MKSEVIINATAKQVYNALTTYDDYVIWNPLVIKAVQEPNDTDGEIMTGYVQWTHHNKIVSYRITHKKEPTEITWRKRGWSKHIVHEEKTVRIIELGHRQVKYVVRIVFSGLFTSLFTDNPYMIQRALDGETYALKKYVEDKQMRRIRS